ncbi:MAG: hypothetical protein N3A38_04900 [Planctomycetota bacterium]|nr:hypothetical protein [Planctomycetota bacterium]
MVFAKRLCAILAVVAGGTASADMITLKSGTKLSGEVLENGDIVRLSTGITILPIRKVDVEAVEISATDREEYARRAAMIGAGDAKGHYELAEWCRSKQFYSLMRKELEATVAADPSHKEAAELLRRIDAYGCVVPPDSKSGGGRAVVRPRSPEDVAEEAKKLGVTPEALFKARMKWIADEEAKDLFIAELIGDIGALSGGNPSQAARAKERLARLGDKACPCVAALADFRQVSDPTLRASAIKGIETLCLKSPEISASLAAAAMADPKEELRHQACRTIKSTGDVGAMAHLIQFAITPEWGAVEPAVAALREINDPRIVRGLFYYVTLEMRPTMTELVNFQTRQLDAFNVMSGANANLVTLLSFPIQFPEMRVTRVRTTVKLPAMSALVAVSGKDFGDNLVKWREWVERQ